MTNNIILTGPPRSGTTLACSLLNELPNTAALHEPMNLKMFPDPVAALEQLAGFFQQMRQQILQTGTAFSKVKGTAVPSNPFAENRSSQRASIVRKGILKFDKPFSDDFQLIIKQNGHFTFMLPDLALHYPVYVILRHPIATIASWNTIQAPVAAGNLRVLASLNPGLYQQLNEIPDLLDRQVQLLVEMYDRYAGIPKERFIYYEDLIATQGRALKQLVPAAAELENALRSKNRNPLYDDEVIEQIKVRLEAHSSVFQSHYSLEQIREF